MNYTSLIKIQMDMEYFHRKCGRMPNTILLPAEIMVSEIRITEVLGLNVVYAAIKEPQVCFR